MSDVMTLLVQINDGQGKLREDVAVLSAKVDHVSVELSSVKNNQDLCPARQREMHRMMQAQQAEKRTTRLVAYLGLLFAFGSMLAAYIALR